MYKKSILEDVKNIHDQREICIILKNHHEKPNRGIKREFCHKFKQINKQVLVHLDQISKLSYLLPTKIPVTLTSPSFPIYNDSVSDCFAQISALDNLRILVNFERINGPDVDSIIYANPSISHLVELSFLDHSSDDLNTTSSPSATIYIEDLDDLLKLIEEIMLDICMYYTMFDDKKIYDTLFRKEISIKKAEFLKKQGIENSKWNLDTNKGYVSFATIFNASKTFDYQAYIKFWEDFGKTLNINGQPKKYPSIISQLRRHKDYGELPVKKIILQYETLPKGQYFLARIKRIPRRHKAQRTLVSIFGGSVLKRGKFKIFPADKLPNLNGFENYVSLFKLIK